VGDKAVFANRRSRDERSATNSLDLRQIFPQVVATEKDNCPISVFSKLRPMTAV
jgi:hypothetical protein